MEEWSVRPAYTAQSTPPCSLYLAGDGGDVVQQHHPSGIWNPTQLAKKVKQNKQIKNTRQKHVYEFHEHQGKDFPGGPVVLRIHPLATGTRVQFWSKKIPRASEQRSPCPQLRACSLEPCPSERSYCSEKPPHCRAESPPPATTRKSPGTAMTQLVQNKQRNK